MSGAATTASPRPRGRWRRRLPWALPALLLAALGAVALLLAGSLPQLDGRVSVHGLDRPVTVTRDHNGVPALRASDRDDLAYALGYIHAQERFFEMDLMRRDAAGELAALVGPAALKRDLDHRRHRFRALAHAAVARLPADQKALLDAYTAGVNAGLTHLRVRPWAYLLLRARPQPWRDEDTLLVVEAMFFDLNGGGDNHRELDIDRMRAALPTRLVDFLLARDGHWEAPLQGAPAPPVRAPDVSVYDLRHAPDVAETGFQMASRQLPGSNSFAVAGALTGGGALVANDMHLGLRVPNIWYRAQMRYRDDDGHTVILDGLTLPGTPLLIAGSNGHIAWGFTNSYGDWMDWVRVRHDPHDNDLYRVPGGWAHVVHHREVIRVKGAPSHTLDVRDTRWGPIMARDDDGTPLALAWVAQLPRVLNLNLAELEHVTNVHEALVVAPTIGMPPQNFIVGDADGHIGWTLTGNALPLRAGFDPSRPADWSKQGTGWIGFASPLQYPRIEDPTDGRLWTANNRTVDGAWLTLEGDGGYDLGARARQIRDDLMARDHFRAADMLDIQLDDRALFLARWQQLLATTLAAHPDKRLDALRRLTAKAPARASIDSVDYRLVRAFRSAVVRAALAPFASRVKSRYRDFVWPADSEAAVWAMVTQKPVNLLDPKYDSWDALLLDAARGVDRRLGRGPGGLAAKTWGRRNVADIEAPLARALPPLLRRWLSMPHDELPGDRDMPRVQAPRFGASERFGIMPGHEDRSYLHMPAGQSDHPLSPYYGAGHEDWVHGRATALRPGPTRYTLTLTPATDADSTASH